MSMSPRLPPECIQLIAEHLLAAQAPCTLCSLLRTSKSMFTLVAPIVFREPFHEDKVPEEKLCRLLLGSKPVEQLPKELQIAYFPELSLSSPPTATQHSVDYTSFIRHIHFNLNHTPLLQQVRDPLTTYVVHALEPNQYQAFLEFSGLWDRDLIFSGLLRVALTWLLCSSAPERIQSIDIPLSDIDRYVSVVDRFHSLSSVNFITDFSADIRLHPTNTPSQQLIAKTFETMARFVEEMVRLFGTQLRTVTLVKHLDHECPPEILQRILQMLPPLDHPQQLDSTNWNQLITHLELTCLDRVKKISTPRGEEWHEILSKSGPIWPRCQSLETLELQFYPSPMLIQWAIKEKEERQRGLGCPGLPLKRIHIRQYVDKEILHIDDLLAGFLDTLEEVYYACRDRTLDSYPPTPQTFSAVASQRVAMPKLKYLTVCMIAHHLPLDPIFLTLFPALEVLSMLNFHELSDPATRPWFEPACLPHLRSIYLGGAMALGFNMETFASSPLVRTIQLFLRDASTNFDNDSDVGDDDGRVYSYDHLPNSPHQWSWSWHLPCLTSLNLGLGFAAWFEFRMLDRCPALEILSLRMMGPETPREGRLVSESDLGSCRSEFGYISCPRLEQLTLTGHWILSPQVLQVLFAHVMPNATSVHSEGCRGHDATDWVRAVRQMDTLKDLTASCPGPIGEDEVADLGLKLWHVGMSMLKTAVERHLVWYQFGGWMYILRDATLE